MKITASGEGRVRAFPLDHNLRPSKPRGWELNGNPQRHLGNLSRNYLVRYSGDPQVARCLVSGHIVLEWQEDETSFYVHANFRVHQGDCAKAFIRHVHHQFRTKGWDVGKADTGFFWAIRSHLEGDPEVFQRSLLEAAKRVRAFVLETEAQLRPYEEKPRWRRLLDRLCGPVWRAE